MLLLRGQRFQRRKSARIWDFMSGTMPDGATLTRASAGTRISSSALLVSETNDVARFNYDKSGSIEGRLVEPATTNQLVGSQSVFSINWDRVSNATNNVSAAPDGTTTMEQITESNGAGQFHYGFLDDSFGSPAASAVIVLSCYAQFGVGTRHPYIAWRSNNNGDFASQLFDLTSKGLGQYLTGGASGTLIGAQFKEVIPGFYRVSLVASVNDTSYRAAFGLAPAASGLSTTYPDVPRFDNGNGRVYYDGDGISALNFWGFQIEIGQSAPTSYLATAYGGSPVSRAADVCVLPIADGNYDIDITRLSGVTHLTGVTVSGGAYIVPVDASPLQSVVATAT